MTGPAPLRVIVYPHSMELGGSQLNAIEIAAAVRDLGHDVMIYADDGVLVDRVLELGLRYVQGADSRTRPGLGRARHLARLVRALDVDVVHGYEWPPALEAFAATALLGSVPSVATVMSMAVAPFLPSTMALAVGTARIQAAAQQGRRTRVHLLEPPVDTRSNRPGTGGGTFRAENGIDEGTPLVVTVSRLAHELKLEGLLTAIDTVGLLARTRAVRLVIVGDGPARSTVAEAAAKANAEAGSEVIVLKGSLADPRGAYDAADVLIGMGGSALRGLAFAKPLIVQGEQGFFETLTPASTDLFLQSGWYGTGPGVVPGVARARLVSLLVPLLDDPSRRRELGALGRVLVEERFSLDAAAAQQVEIYRSAIEQHPGLAVRLADGAVAGVGLLRYEAARRVARSNGTASVDDFNAKPT